MKVALMHCACPSKQNLLCIVTACCIAGIFVNTLAETAPITSSGLNTQISGPIHAGGQVQYDITSGTRVGTNLFHSFGEFGVPNHTIANFHNDSGLSTSNILGRVTGGNESQIFGTIRTSGFDNANLFLMNPAGFLFGPNATVNVGGMATFTSADYLRLSDGKNNGYFYAHPTGPSLLTASPVAAFGFLGSNPEAIRVQGGKLEGTGITLVGGKITIESGTSEGKVHRAQLLAPNGTIQLAVAASPGEFDTTLQPLSNVKGTSFTSFGSVTLKPDSTINLSGTGKVSIRGGQFVLSAKDAVLTTAKSSGTPNLINLSPNSSILSSTSIAEPGPNVQIEAATIKLTRTDITALNSDSSGGKPGNISLQATQQITIVDSFLNTDTVGGPGQGGNILFRAPTIGIDGGVLAATTSGKGQAGNVLLEGRQISLGASPSAAEQGQAQGVDLYTGTSGPGKGGTVTLRGLGGSFSHADTVTISGSSNLHTLTSSDGSAGAISIRTDRFILSDHATLKADTFGAGDGGTITIVAGQSATLTRGAQISANSTGSGDAGNIQIDAGNSFLATNSSVTTEAKAARGGNITIQAIDSVQLVNGKISTSVRGGAGSGGNITIDPNIVILQNSAILAQAVHGKGGDITIRTQMFMPDSFSLNHIDATAPFGLNGTVRIQSPYAPASGKIQPLGNRPLQATLLLNQSCAAMAGGQFSSFTVAGRNSLPTEPSGWLSSPLALASPESIINSITNKGRGLSLNGPTGEPFLLSLRQIAPPGFLTRAFAVEESTGCSS